METYLTIEGLAAHLKLAEQTIRRWVLNREIPFCKIKKVIRFRLSEIERWVDNGGICLPLAANERQEDSLFDVADSEGAGETDRETDSPENTRGEE
jgi:PTS system nitrogen regulatory IIA component